MTPAWCAWCSPSATTAIVCTAVRTYAFDRRCALGPCAGIAGDGPAGDSAAAGWAFPGVTTLGSVGPATIGASEADWLRECASFSSSSNEKLDSPAPGDSCERAVLITWPSDAPERYGMAK